MQFCRYFLTIFLFILLQACVSTMSPHMSQELQYGKLKFEEGDYQTAFCELLPIAANGCVEAEYAVGYMYYYGYGVPRDCHSGIFWMTRAAQHNYPPAIQALMLIRQGPPPCIDYPHPDYCYGHDWIRTGPRYGLPPAYGRPCHSPCGAIAHPYGIPPGYAPHCCHKCPPGTISPPKMKSVYTIGLNKSVGNNSAELNNSSAPPDHHLQKNVVTVAKNSHAGLYSLQLFGAYHLTDVEKLQNKLHLQKSTSIFHTQNKGKDWYILTFGNYATVADAKSVVGRLPMQARDLGPWVRKIG